MRRFFLPVICIALLALPAGAQRVVVRKSGSAKITINLAAYRTGGDAASREFLATLQADLNRSGYFNVTAAGAELNVTGKFAAGSGGLQTECQVLKASDRQRIMGTSYQAGATETRGLAHRVADDIVRAVTGHKGMASGKIALVSNRTGKKELYVCDMDGKGVRQVTNDRSIVVGTGWAPDAKSVIFTSYMQGYPNIYLVDLFSGKRSKLSSFGGLNTSGAISPDGRSMAMILSVHGNPELYVKNLRTGKVTRLTQTRRANEASPTWSPDGGQIAYVSDQSGKPQIYIMPSGGGAAARLTSTGTENVAPEWGPAGVAFASLVGGRYRIAVANPASRTVRVLETDGADYEDPSWARDGRHIVCSRTAGYRSSIYLLDTLGDSHIALISASGDWYSPTCSP